VTQFMHMFSRQGNERSETNKVLRSLPYKASIRHKASIRPFDAIFMGQNVDGGPSSSYYCEVCNKELDNKAFQAVIPAHEWNGAWYYETCAECCSREHARDYLSKPEDSWFKHILTEGNPTEVTTANRRFLMLRICVFDVNETLLDLRALDPYFARVFGNAALRPTWFTQMLQTSLVATITDAYTDFGTNGVAALDMLAARQQVTLTAADRQELREGMQHLPPHPDVVASLEQLRSAGFRLTTLTNSTAQVAEAQLANAGLTSYFERIFSADSVHRLKPAPEPYRMVAQQMSVEISNIRLIAAHAWDIAGALRAGCAAAFVARPGAVLDPLVPKPDIVGPDLHSIATQIIEREQSAS